ncbi:hypothetical protein ACJZ2D_014702 [Fusarium nematophilum]
MAIEAMRGIVFGGAPFEVTVQDVPVPTILNETDVIVHITMAGICGSDLHTYRRFQYSGPDNATIGNKAIGWVSKTGSAVTSLSVGDYVVIPDMARNPSI